MGEAADLRATVDAVVLALLLVPVVVLTRRFRPTTWAALMAEIDRLVADLPAPVIAGAGGEATLRRTLRAQVVRQLWRHSVSLVVPIAAGWVALAAVFLRAPGLVAALDGALPLVQVGVAWALAVGSVKFLIHPGYFLAEGPFYLALAVRRMGLDPGLASVARVFA